MIPIIILATWFFVVIDRVQAIYGDNMKIGAGQSSPDAEGILERVIWIHSQFIDEVFDGVPYRPTLKEE